jgi:murein DD-endopeptidase MepM/ murein hydrolase activator NlpD
MLDRDFKSTAPARGTRRPRARHFMIAGGVSLLGVMLAGFGAPSDARIDPTDRRHDGAPDHSETFPSSARLHIDLALPQENTVVPPTTDTEGTPQKGTTRTVTVSRGDTLSGIFKHNDILRELPAVMKAGAPASALERIRPGETLTLTIDSGHLLRLHYRPQNGDELTVIRTPEGLQASTVQHHYEHRLFQAGGSIQNSLFLDGHRAGLSDRLIMQLAEIFGWDIDFALDLRPGDHFTVVYDTLYEHGVRVREGDIVAAEFVNQGRSFRAVRYTDPNGHSDYYTPDGHSLRKAFLRTPVQFSRISSRFNLHRKHPILNRVRAHKGVDYAAPVGTPVRAAGDGKVVYKGWKGGYGRFIVLQHGQRYSTAYGHLSRFAAKLRSGARVHQGQVIGYVGQSGLATGPHLHYEFRINGRHRNPLKVKLPAAKPLQARYVAAFEAKALPLLAQIDSYRRATLSRFGDS